MCCVSSPLLPCCSKRMHVSTPASQQHLTNLANYLLGRFYMAFLIAGKESEVVVVVGLGVDLMKGYGHPKRLGFHLHTLPRRSQSPTEEAPVRLSQSPPPRFHPTPRHGPLTHSSFIPPSLRLLSLCPPPASPHQNRKKKSPSRAGVFRQMASGEGRAQRRGNRPGGSKWVRAWEGGVREWGSEAPGARRPSARRGGKTRPTDQVFDSIT